jgi:hypothetical protein
VVGAVNIVVGLVLNESDTVVGIVSNEDSVAVAGRLLLFVNVHMHLGPRKLVRRQPGLRLLSVVRVEA